MEIKQINPYKQIIEPTGDQKVPVVFNVSEDLMPNKTAIKQLEEVASDPHVFHHIAALTDVHNKKGRRNPTGTAVATKGAFLPQLVDSAPNCGMRLIKTPFSKDDLNKDQINELFNELVEVIPTKVYVGTPLSYKTIIDVSLRGAAAILEKYKKDTSLLKNIQKEGNAFEEEKITKDNLLKSVPNLFFRIAQLRLGVLGAAGNHFLDLMEVTDILDDEMAKKFDLKEGQYVFMMHTGSGMFGQYNSYFYMPKKKEHLSQKIITELARLTFLNNRIPWHKQLEEQIPQLENKKEFWAIKENSDLARHFMIAHKASANHGVANRTLLQINLERAIDKVLKKKVDLPIIYDMSHISIQKENHFSQDMWIHRNGTIRAFGPQRMKGVPLYEETGEPVFLPSSMSTPAYLGVATDENQDTFFSAAHGTGKSKTKTSEVPSDKQQLLEKMRGRGVRLYNAQSKGIIDQDASHYKDVEPGITAMTNNKVMKPVAKMMPVAVLMA